MGIERMASIASAAHSRKGSRTNKRQYSRFAPGPLSRYVVQQMEKARDFTMERLSRSMCGAISRAMRLSVFIAKKEV